MTAQAAHELRLPDGVRVSFDLFHAPGQRRALIIGHGFYQSKETATFQRLARALAADQDVVNMDFRGHGRSSGLFTFSAREGAELEAVLAWTRERYDAITLMGFSLGGAIVLTTVSRSPEKVAGVIAVSAPAAFEDIEFKFWTPEAIRTGWQGSERGSGCRPGNPFLPKQRPVDHVGRLNGIPLLLVHGTRDVIVGIRHGRRLFEAARDPKQLKVIEGGSHAEALFRDDPEGFLGVVRNWPHYSAALPHRSGREPTA